MTIRVTAAVVDTDVEAAAEVLRHIADQLEEGFIAGQDRDQKRRYTYEVTEEPT